MRITSSCLTNLISVSLHSIQRENVSATLQGEFLKIVEGTQIPVKVDQTEHMIDTSKMSFVFCGSFAIKADEIRERSKTSGLGFGAEKHEEKQFEKELSMKDVIDFGVIPELASRTTRIINVRPLTLDDYRFLIADHSGSPMRRLERVYDRKFRLSKAKIDDIAKNAFDSGLGIRNVTAQLQQIMDERIFNSFPDADEETKESRKKPKSSDGKGEEYVF